MKKNAMGHIELEFRNVNCVGANAVVAEVVLVPDRKGNKK